MALTRTARPAAPVSVERYLARIRVRAGAIYGLRALSAAAGTFGMCFASLSLAVGPVVPLGWAIACWVGALLLSAGAGWVALHSLTSLRGGQAAKLIRRAHGGLASAAQSAVELRADARTSALAPDLVQAHRARVEEALVGVRPRDVVPLRTVRRPATLAGLVALLVGLGLLFGSDRAASGAWALAHPGLRDDDGTIVAAVVADVFAELTFPAYMGKKPESLDDPVGIEAPRGTSVRYTVRPRIAASEAVLRVAGRDLRLEKDSAGRFAGRFVVREGGAIRVRVRRSDRQWLTDPTPRWLHAVPDDAPRVVLAAPETDRTAELDEPVAVVYEARDDVGLTGVSLVVRTLDGQETRRSLARLEESERRTDLAGSADLVAAELGARPGDTLVIFIEAEDGDVVSGPNVGRSDERHIRVASTGTRRLVMIAQLEDVLDLGLTALADRLEWPIPDTKAPAKDRFERVNASTKAFVGALATLSESNRKANPGPVDPATYATMARRLKGVMARERGLHRRKSVGTVARRAKVDRDAVDELEQDALTLADLVGKARIEDAASVTRELEALRREMHSLIEEIRRADTPEARRALMAALARSEARLRELARRLTAMGEDVPSDFINADALPQRESQNAVAGMREALERGDLDGVEARLRDLERQINAIAKALGAGEQSFRAARFGPRERAMAEALDALAGLESEQRDLAQRTESIRREAAERALEASGALDPEKMKRLAESARKARKDLSRVPKRSLGPPEEETLDRARQRLKDAEDALLSGDLGEARRMARQGAEDAERLARDLELSALMFPGHGGRTAEAAEAADHAADKARELGHALDQALPRIADFVDDAQGKRMQEDEPRQARARDAADRLGERLGTGPDGMPLSPDGASTMKEVRAHMEQARGHLDRLDPLEAAREQHEAARRLSELRNALEKNQSGDPSGGGGGGDRGGRPDFRQRVHIPDAKEHQGPVALRRRVLDAMREDVPPGYEESIRRYYEELLR